MAWQLRRRIDGRGKWLAILSALRDLSIDFARYPCELVVRSERVEKTPADRGQFHAACADLAPLWGETPGAVKQKVKEDFYGADVVIEKGVLTPEETQELGRLLSKLGHYSVVVQSSEDSDQEEYRRLIAHLYQMAAESGHQLIDRRTK